MFSFADCFTATFPLTLGRYRQRAVWPTGIEDGWGEAKSWVLRLGEGLRGVSETGLGNQGLTACSSEDREGKGTYPVGFWRSVDASKGGGKGCRLEGQISSGMEVHMTRETQEWGSQEGEEYGRKGLSSGTCWWPLMVAFQRESGHKVSFHP